MSVCKNDDYISVLLYVCFVKPMRVCLYVCLSFSVLNIHVFRFISHEIEMENGNDKEKHRQQSVSLYFVNVRIHVRTLPADEARLSNLNYIDRSDFSAL